MHKPPLLIPLLTETYLFKNLTAEELINIEALSQHKTFEPGQTLIHEGTAVPEVLIVLSGEVEIKKADQATQQLHHVVNLTAGETIGEMCLLDLEPASASAIAINKTEVLAIPITALRAADFFSRLVANIATRLNQRLRYTNTITVKSLQQELEINKKITFVMRFFITTLLILLLYVMLLNIAIRYLSIVKASTIITVPFLIVFLLMSLYGLKTSHMPASFFGLTTKNWRASVIDSLKFTIPAMLALTLLKWILVHYTSSYADEPLFNPFGMFRGDAKQTATVTVLILFATIYSAFSIVQEFLVRCVVQGSLEYFLQGRHKVLVAILLANLIFSVLHMHVSTIFAVLVFIPGLLWGFLYHRNKSLIGVSLSHILIGVWGGFILGFDFILQ